MCPKLLWYHLIASYYVLSSLDTALKRIGYRMGDKHTAKGVYWYGIETSPLKHNPVASQQTTHHQNIYAFMLSILWAKHIKTETPWLPFCGQYFQIILLNYQICRILIQISLKFVHRSLINNEPALVQTMDCHQSGEKPFTDAYMRHSVSVVLSIA